MPEQAWARGGGGCLAKGTPILTPSGPVPIEQLHRGDAVWTVLHSRILPGIVQDCIKVEADEFLELQVAGRTLRVTPEHPFQIAPGVFRQAADLKTGYCLYVKDDGALCPTPIISIQKLPFTTRQAYNLLVSPGGTYLADGVIVHNKGCFLPDTSILKADGTSIPIKAVQPGDRLLAFTLEGKIVKAVIRNVLTYEVDEYCLVATDRVVLRVTPEHPFFVGRGTFRTQESLHVGDQIFAYDGQALTAQSIIQIKRIREPTRVYNLQTDRPNTFFANGIAVHNKGGGCFPAGTLICTPIGSTPIESLAIGDKVTAIDDDGRDRLVTVQAVEATRSALLIIHNNQGILRTTAEHPVWTSRRGFIPAEELRAGDRILSWQGGRLRSVRVHQIESSSKQELVFNLLVDAPHTFVADGFVVHNKGGGFGGGGGFHGSGGYHSYSSGSGSADLPNQNILGYCAMIGSIAGGVGGFGFGVRRLFRPTTIHGFMWVLGFLFGPFIFCGIGAVMGLFAGALLGLVIILLFEVPGLIITFIFVILGIANAAVKATNKKDEDLDFAYSPDAVAPKATKTKKLLDFLARQDSSMAVEKLQETARSTFLKLQECWQARDYGPMKPLLMPDLYAQHCSQLAGMKRNHEINLIADLQVERVDIVNVRYSDKADHREFTALISARARDYYIDDRDQKFLRGDSAPARFQEFWTFQLQNGAWLLREVEQSRESDKLKEENFVEMFTDKQVQSVYADTAGPSGPAGPWLEKSVETKASRTERLLNFLVQTDKLWDRKQMLERARQVFLNVLLAQETGDPSTVKDEELFPDVAEDLRTDIRQRQEKGSRIEFRNLCVRKVELILVRNYADNNKDEYTVRISAHAQKILSQAGRPTAQEDYVTPFEQYWTFGRLDRQWKLKEILPPTEGEQMIAQENVDEESDPATLQWFYTKSRAG
jgi:predicted lipid-binding transport protein (Tim44 family)